MSDVQNSSVYRQDLLEGKSALVTGGASGIGAAICRGLAEAGARVTVCDINETAAQNLATELDGDALVLDLADTDSLEGLSLNVDILVNNAGIQHVSPIVDFDADKWRFIQRLMLEAPFLLIKAALPHMYRQNFGRIINLSSAHGVRASAYKAAYVSAKHGLEGLSKVTALEGAEYGVTSNCVNPGYVSTPLVENQIAEQAAAHQIPREKVVKDILLKRPAIKEMVSVEEVASMVVWLSSDAAKSVTGASYLIDGGWSAS